MSNVLIVNIQNTKITLTNVFMIVLKDISKMIPQLELVNLVLNHVLPVTTLPSVILVPMDT